MIPIKKKLHSEIKEISQIILKANSIILTTHKHCDGDGLGSQIALFHALKKIKKDVRIFCVDSIPKKYDFLNHKDFIEIFENPHEPIGPTNLGLILDTNDSRLVEPLFSRMKKQCEQILFIDHHPLLSQGPEPDKKSLIDVSAASTGEMIYFIIKECGIAMDTKIARALYTSIAFDTQIFRYIKNSPTSHIIASELLQYEDRPQEIHQHLFSNYSRGKIKLLALALKDIEFIGNKDMAFLSLSQKSLEDNSVSWEETRDIIDMIMNISDIKAAALVHGFGKNKYKLSLRCRSKYSVLKIAESFNGGGHHQAAGAYLEGDFKEIRKEVIDSLINLKKN